MMQEDIAWVREMAGARYAPLYRFLLARLPHREDAEDLAQETFLRLLRVPQTDLIRHPDAYLFRIAANLLLEFRLRIRRSLVAFDSEQAEAAGEVAAGENGAAPAELLLDTASLERAIAELPPRQRTALLLQRRDGLTYAQIGEQLGVSPDMVKKYLGSAIARCRLTLGESQ